MKILMLGDTHCDPIWVEHAIAVAKRNGCSRIVQLGDFGYWPHMPDGQRFLTRVSKSLVQAGLPLYWLDGNHENHDAIADLLNPLITPGSRIPTAPFVLHAPAVHYIPRGSRWEWDGVKFLALGGAYSIDKNHRTPGLSWWAGETITDADVERAIAGGEEVDVMLSHDCPFGAHPFLDIDPVDRQKDRWPESRANRERLRMVCDVVRPKELFHGHYHKRYDELITIGRNDISPLQIHGLGKDGDRDGSTYVFDTEAFRAS